MENGFKSVVEVLAGKRQEATLIPLPNFSDRAKVPLVRAQRPHDVFFCGLFGIWLVLTILGTAAFSLEGSYKFSLLVFVAIVINDLLFDSHRRVDVLFLALLGVIAMNAHRVGNTPFGMNLVIIYCARNLDFKSIVKLTVALTAVTAFAIVAANQVGLIRDVLVPRGSEVRHSLGFAYATYSSHYYLDIVLGYFFLRKNSYRYIELAGAFLVDAWVYWQTDSRNSFLLVSLVLVALAAVKLFRDSGVPLERLKTAIAYVAPLSFVVCALISSVVLLWVPADSGQGARLDAALSSRLTLSQDAFETYQIRPLGNKVTFSGWSDQGDGYMVAGHSDENGNFVRTKYSYVDSSYLQTLIVEGFIPYALLLLMLTVGALWLVQEKEYMAAAFMCIFALRGIIDPQLHMINYCCLLFAAWRPLESDVQPAGDTVPALGKIYVRMACGSALAITCAVTAVTLLVNYGIPMPIDQQHFEDDALRSYVLDKVDVDGDGKLSKLEVRSLTSMAISNATSLNGLNVFPNLQSIQAFGDSLREADMSGVLALRYADFSGAPNLEKLTLSGNASLAYLNVTDTKIESLDLADAKALRTLKCAQSVDVQGAPQIDAYPLQTFTIGSDDGNGASPSVKVEAGYDSDGRLVSRNISGDNEVDIEYEYDEKGALVRVGLSGNRDLNGDWSLEYGENGSDLHATGSDGQHVDRIYDDAGRVRSLSIRSKGFDGVLDASLEYEYDGYGMLSTIKTTSGGVTKNYRVDYYSNGSVRDITLVSDAQTQGDEAAGADEEYVKIGALGTRQYVPYVVSPPAEKRDASGTYTYEWQQQGHDATMTRIHYQGDSVSKTVGAYRYEGKFGSPIWGSIVDYASGESKRFDKKFAAMRVPALSDYKVGNVVDFYDITDPIVETDYWLPKSDIAWLVRHEVSAIISTQETTLLCRGASTYYDDEVYGESNKAYDAVLPDTLSEVQDECGSAPQFAYYDIDGDQVSELLISDGHNGIARIYGQMRGVPFLSRGGAQGEKLSLSSQGFLVATTGSSSHLEQYNGITFDLVDSPADDAELPTLYPALRNLEWHDASELRNSGGSNE